MLPAEAASSALLVGDAAARFAALLFGEACYPAGEALLGTEAAALLTTEAFSAVLLLPAEAAFSVLLG